jgi:hypothetical protein
MANNTPAEAEEQAALVEWLELKGWKFTAIPNSTYTTSWRQKAKNRRLGLRAGLPDLLIILPDRRGLVFVEMKRTKGGVVAPAQADWIRELDALEGVKARVCRGADEAIEFLTKLS